VNESVDGIFAVDYTMSDKTKSAGDEIIFQISESVTARKYEKASELIKLCAKNAEFYKHDKSFIGTRMCSAFDKLSESLEKSVLVSRKIDSFAQIYDFDAKTPGNGYRSFLHIYDSALDYALKTTQYINDNRGSLLFRKSSYLK
jgi:Hormone-sensitive lipase (HSL) N-terminus